MRLKLNLRVAISAVQLTPIHAEFQFHSSPQAHGVSFSFYGNLNTLLCDYFLLMLPFLFTPALIFIIFAGSCCCCSIVFLSAEHSRLKEGLTFREAYLIPIPLVAAEIDSGDKDYLFPPDQPTAIARAQTSIDIPVAEPTEHSSLVGQHHSERSALWQ